MTARPRLPITFLSDYGHEDEFVGVCHGVIERIAPGARVIDVAHGLLPHDVRAAAVVLRNVLPFMPAGVHLAVVDPGVGSGRRAVALAVGDGRFLVGPDNGLLWLAAERFGEVTKAVEISGSPFRLEPVSFTFHGRDLFAPVAAQLALGTPLEAVGAELDPSNLERLELEPPSIRAGAAEAEVLAVDRFGNLQLNLDGDQFGAAGLAGGAGLRVGSAGGGAEARESAAACFGRTFADAPAGALVVYVDSYGAVAVAVNRGSAAARLGAEAGDRVLLSQREQG
jgi:S-adenosyl-L-methionine hydrolase (adenosine-forming)